MNIADVVTRQVQEGFRPAQISDDLQLPLDTVVCHFSLAVLAGKIRWSDVLFTFPHGFRELANTLLADKSPNEGTAALQRVVPAFASIGREANPDEAHLYSRLYYARVVTLDLFAMLTGFERTLHDRVGACLRREFRQPPEAWWNKGVPQAIRKQCVIRQQEDEDPGQSPYGYTTMIDLKSIITHQWALFSLKLPASAAKQKKQLEARFDRMNKLRNQVMHPLRTRDFSEDDYRFVRDSYRDLAATPWR